MNTTNAKVFINGNLKLWCFTIIRYLSCSKPHSTYLPLIYVFVNIWRQSHEGIKRISFICIESFMVIQRTIIVQLFVFSTSTFYNTNPMVCHFNMFVFQNQWFGLMTYFSSRVLTNLTFKARLLNLKQHI